MQGNKFLQESTLLDVLGSGLEFLGKLEFVMRIMRKSELSTNLLFLRSFLRI